MAGKSSINLQIKLNVPDGDAPEVQAYLFTAGGKLIGVSPVKQGTAAVQVPQEFDGTNAHVLFGPVTKPGQTTPTMAGLKRMGAVSKATRILSKVPAFELTIPVELFPTWCLCTVKGRLVKNVTLPDGTIGQQPVCNARVTICEVDAIPLIITKIPDVDIFKLRDDLLDRLKVIPRPFPPKPEPDPWELAQHGSHDGHQMQSRLQAVSKVESANAVQDQRVIALSAAASAHHVRERLIDISDLIAIHICDLTYIWHYFRKDCLTTVEADHNGYFSTIVAYECSDKPDLYFSVEQFSNGAWNTVYKPSIGCGTHWNYNCGTQIVINVPGAHACEEPTYDLPPGVTRFVLPYAIGSTPVWGIPSGAPAAPDGWLRQDGKVNYATGSSLGWLYDAPFGHTLNFIHDDSYFIPSSDIKYYRYSYRRLVSGGPENTGANDATWTPISTPLARGYRMEYSDRLPTYESYGVGPLTVGAQSGLFEFKPQQPPARPTDPATVVVREWTSGNLSEVGASWDTLAAAPPLSDVNVGDDAGIFEVKIEAFDASGSQVLPGGSTFRFLNRNADGTTTRLSTAAEEAGGAYVMRVHVDNNGTSAALPQPSIGGVSASDDCGFLRYADGDVVRIEYLAAHPNNHAVFGFGVTRGSNGLAAATTLSPYVEVASATAPTGTSPYNKVGDYYRRDFAPSELVGTCVNAAFAANLSVIGKATNGYHRIGLDAHRLIAFALAEQHEE